MFIFQINAFTAIHRAIATRTFLVSDFFTQDKVNVIQIYDFLTTCKLEFFICQVSVVKA